MNSGKLQTRSERMKRYAAIFWVLCTILIPRAQGQTSAPLKQIQSIPLPNVEGYFDHMAVDIKGQRLFVPGEHQRTIEVIDLRAGKVIHTITGFMIRPPIYFIWVTEPMDSKKRVRKGRSKSST